MSYNIAVRRRQQTQSSVLLRYIVNKPGTGQHIMYYGNLKGQTE